MAISAWPKLNLLARSIASFGASLGATVALAAIVAGPMKAEASVLGNWRWGVSVGYGGLGITSKQTLTDTSTGTVNRSEGPLVVDAFLDRLITDNFGVTFEHSRGVSLSPASTGESFTGLVARWYFYGPAPSMVSSTEGSTLLVKRFVPFVGLAAGYAEASIHRDPTDLAPLLSGSGAYFGTRLGFDYATGPGTGIRPQIVYSSTAFTNGFSKTETPSTLTQFSLQCGWYFDF